MNRDADIKLEILRKLNDARAVNYLTPQKMLFEQVAALVTVGSDKPPPTPAEFKDCLDTLESTGLVKGVTSALGGPLRWKITDAGRGELSDLTHGAKS
jgi:hypothetical protein